MDSGMGSIRSVDRALMILDKLSREPDGMTLSVLAADLDLPPSTCHRLLTALEVAGFVHRWAGRGRYSLGYRLYQLATQSGGLDAAILSAAREAMERLNQELGETCNLACREGLMARYIFQVAARTPMRLFTTVGAAVPLYSSGVGKVLLADAPEVVFESVALDLKPYTHTTIADPVALRLEIDRIRGRGYAIDNEEYQDGVMCVAVPVYDFTGSVHAALSVAGPATRIARSLSSIVTAAQAAAQQISEWLGKEAATETTAAATTPRAPSQMPRGSSSTD